MMVRAQIGDSPNVRILVLGPGLIHRVVLLGDVHTALILFAIGVHHGSAISAAGVAFMLHVPLLLAIAADHVGVSGAIASEWGGVDHRSGCWSTSGCRTRLTVLTNGGDLVEVFVSDFVPKNCSGFFWSNCCFDGGNFVRPPLVVMDRFQFSGQLHALPESGLASFKDPVPDGLLDAG